LRADFLEATISPIQAAVITFPCAPSDVLPQAKERPFMLQSKFAFTTRFPAVWTVPLLLVSLFLVLCLIGCEPSVAPSLAGGELPVGVYYVVSAADEVYQYEDYFMVLAGNRWEFVEYGFKSGNRTSLCKATRKAGTYALGDSTLTSTVTALGQPLEQCGLSKALFQANTMVNDPDRPTQIFSIRNITASGFEGKDMFNDAPGWKTYTTTTDPFGFY
jgi:hypothetical protein